MYQKSIVVISAVIIVSLFLIIYLSQKQPQETYIIDDNSVLNGEVMESETVDTSAPITPIEVETEGQMPQGKINVQVACESALIYTTFIDGEAAEAFVDECIEGKHPEVIERFINDMGVDGALI